MPMNVTYIVEESLVDADKELPVGILFGGNQTWQQRDESFILKPSMKVPVWSWFPMSLCEVVQMVESQT